MPKIPTLTAEGTPQGDITPRLRSSGIGAIGESVSALGELLGKLQAQNDDVESHELRARRDAGIAEIHQDLLENPNIAATPSGYLDEFIKRQNALDRQLLGSTTNNNVTRLFNNYLKIAQPGTLATARQRGFKAFTNQQIARLDTLTDNMVFSALTVDTPEAQEAVINDFNSFVDAGAARGIILPTEAVKRKQDFRDAVQVGLMTILGNTDPERLIQMDAAGKFDFVDPVRRAALIDTAVKQQAVKQNSAFIALQKAVTNWRESVKRATAAHVNTRTLTQDWLDTYREVFDDNELLAYGKLLREQISGRTTGEPLVERAWRQRIAEVLVDEKSDLKITFNSILRSYGAGTVGGDELEHQQNRLLTEMHRRETAGRTGRNEEEEIIRRRYADLVTNAELALRQTGIFDLDKSSTEALLQFREAMQRRTRFIGSAGTENPEDVAREELPRAVAQVSERASIQLRQLRERLDFTSVADLRAARSRLGDAKYRDQLAIMEQIKILTGEISRLDRIRKERGSGR